MSTRRNIKYRYLKTKMALSDTVQAILDINRKRRFLKGDEGRREALNEELKVLNAVAENQAHKLRTYQNRIESDERA